ncbi:secretion protein F [Rhodococcus sp. D2-41]|uniref:Secretion protein F n=1 Tax=Speluncibacter jeojiensis TaxID=2710754 RepID=A0A9X4M582_9ACTN|nr:secretion protein F [Rhodococcus sp. D2-41]MDG3009372.1 secretion protein F [Rhodococcus sp. D2-41]MDG3017072.1 secretion protein F [Corynebacteriales bacterium D3-21]
MSATAVTLLAAAVLTAPAGAPARRLRALRGAEAGAGFEGAVRNPALRAGAVAAVSAAAWFVAGWAGPVTAAVGLATARRRRRAAARDRGESDCQRALIGALEVMVGELRIGAHPGAACAAAAAESRGAVARVFREAAARSALGGGVADGLRSARLADDAPAELGAAEGGPLQRVADAWDMAERHGVAMAELLDAVRRDLSGRHGFRSRVRAGLAGARATSTVLALLPLLGVGLGELMGAHPLGVLLGGGWGGALLVVGTVLVCAGLLWSDRIAAKVVR